MRPSKPASQGGLGSQLIGKLEGPEVQVDAPRPAKLGEAPMLAELVKAGKLPPVEQRIPDEPLVIKPLAEIGKYGGTWRRAFTGPGDNENGNRINSSDKMIFWNFNGTKLMPSVAKKWEVGDGGRTLTLFFRKGHKWSDGTPFGADDVLFWYEDLYGNKDLTPTPTAELSINGKPGKIEKVDDLTVRFVFPEPYPGFIDILTGASYVGTSQSNGADAAPWPDRPEALPLPVPAEVRRPGEGRPAGEGRRLRQLEDVLHDLRGGLAAQPGPAGHRCRGR